MSWTLLLGIVLVLGIALLSLLARRRELARMARSIEEHGRAVHHGAGKAQLQHPVIDLSRCLGCGTCVAACPEDGVLELVHGQAMVVRGARCLGIAACERECPVQAITITLGNVEDRDDIPALSGDLEAVGSPGLFLAGEVTAHTLIKIAIEQGTRVAAEVARRVDRAKGPTDVLPYDLCIVGAGPAGLACALEAKRNQLRFILLDQESGPGGTVAKYPRRKLVLTQPVEMPLHGKLRQKTYEKEELIELWQRIVNEHEIPMLGGEIFEAANRVPGGGYEVRTQAGRYLARFVCLAIGRRGTPTKLEVPGEELPNVAYSLLDAQSFQNRRILVVGGGESAVETAMGLAEQPGNQVTLSYRKESFFRLRARNEDRLRECVENDKLQVVFKSEVRAIAPDLVELAVENGVGKKTEYLPNDDVFVMAGGVPPFELLERSGVSFDPALRPTPRSIEERGTGLSKALAIGLGLSLATLLFAIWHLDYYGLPISERPTHDKHSFLRPGLGIGLIFGLLSSAMIVLNLLYVVRRSSKVRFQMGSLKLWMTSHVATGIIAILCATLHGAMSPRRTVGGHAFWALVVLLVTGGIGRYLYAYVPRAANGRELKLAEIKSRLSQMQEVWDQGQRRFRDRVRREVLGLIEAEQWRGSILTRIGALFGVQRALRRVIARLEEEGRKEGIPPDQIHETLLLARRVHRMALATAHFEDLRAVINSWRYLHRWVAALMVLLVILHVSSALAYGTFFFQGGTG